MSNISYLICKKCNDAVFSFHRHDMQYCKCKSVALDGGFDYNKITGDLFSHDLVESDIGSVIKLIRKRFTWTKNYGKNGKLLAKSVTNKLKDLTTDHIVGILLYFTKRIKFDSDLPTLVSKEWVIVHEIFLEELKFRKLKG